MQVSGLHVLDLSHNQLGPECWAPFMEAMMRRRGSLQSATSLAAGLLSRQGTAADGPTVGGSWHACCCMGRSC